MNDILLEATYALTDKKQLTKNDLLCVVLGWRMVELFKNKDGIKSLPPGFSIMSNRRGTEEKDGLISTLLNDTHADKIKHHIHGTHKKDETVELTTKEHTSLHNEIRKLFIAKVQDNPEIDKIFNNFLLTYQKPLKTYEDFGGRLESYEIALKEIALVVHALICDQKVITELYEKAFNQLISTGKITSIKSIDSNKFEEGHTIAVGKELVESHRRVISRGSLLVDNELFVNFD